MPPSENEDQIVRYLLDELDAEERARLEERLFREPSFFEHVASVEDDLIMQYVRGDLDGRLVSRFNEVYLSSPARRARVESARVLQQAVLDNAAKRSTAVSTKRGIRISWLAAAVVAVIVLLAVLWPLWKKHSPGPGPDAGTEVAFSLEPGLVRSGGGVSISVPQVDRVRFTLALANATARKNYRAILGTPERPNAWSGVAVMKGSHLVTVMPADVLSRGDYNLQLQANDGGGKWEDVAVYYFRVER